MPDPITIGIALIVIAVNVAEALRYRRLAKIYKRLYLNAINPPEKKPSLKAIQAQTERERWLEVRSQILLRDHFRCQEPNCNYYKHLEVHHIIPKSKGGTDDPSNLITLCQRCHAKKHGFKHRENRRRKHTRRNRRKKFRRFVNRNAREIRNKRFPIRSMEDVHPHQEDLSSEAVARRQKLYARWQQNELNQT